MIRRLALIGLIALSAGPALAEDAAKPSLDLSRSVTLTGYELQALVRAQIAEAEARSAGAAAAGAVAKLNAALAVPEPEKAK